VRQPLVIGKIIQSIEGWGKWCIDHIIWSNDEKEILIMDGASITLFDISKGAKGKETEFSINQLYDEVDFEEEVRPSPSGVIWSEDGKKKFAWFGKSGSFWDISGKRRVREKEFRNMHRHYWINGACWLKDGEEILTWGKDGTAKIWDAKTGRATKTFMSKINCDGMNISNVKGLNKEKYISLLYKGAIMSVSEIKDLKLSLQTHLNIIFN
jgi:WD40 repeat protein